MRMTKRVLLCVISIVLIFATIGCTAAPPAEVIPTGKAPVDSAANDTVQYAHGTTVDSNGNFVFTYNGEKYDCEFLLAKDFDLEELKSMLVQRYGLKVSYERNQTLKGFIDGIMIDCIRFNYPHLQSPDIIDGVRLESVPDIIAMKLSAIAQNGTRIKDFIDIATLSTQYSLEEMLDFYISKFPMANVMMPIKALTYFDEIDFNESVVMTTGNFNWNKIAKRLNDMVHSSTKIFAVQP